MDGQKLQSPLLSRMEAATYLGVKSSIFSQIQRYIPYVKLHKRKQYHIDDLKNFIEFRKETKDKPYQEKASYSTKGKVRRIGATASPLMAKSLEEVLGLKI